jgi:hypothetical protein
MYAGEQHDVAIDRANGDAYDTIIASTKAYMRTACGTGTLTDTYPTFCARRWPYALIHSRPRCRQARWSGTTGSR